MADRAKDCTSQIENSDDQLADRVAELSLGFQGRRKIIKKEVQNVYKSDWDRTYCGKHAHGAANYFENPECNLICKKFHKRGHIEATCSVSRPPQGVEESRELRSNNGDQPSYITGNRAQVLATTNRNLDGEPLQKQVRTDAMQLERVFNLFA